jgi:isopenicillin N synthase-like dioxygenase
MHAHRDSSTFLTTLIQSRPGLQVQNHKGEWLDVPMVDGGVIVNIGMKFMQLTGGHLVATNHRVNTLNIDADRYTIPYVLTPRLDAIIKPLPQFARPEAAKEHAPASAATLKLMAIEDPCVRSGFARITLFPAATQKLYPKEFQQALDMGIIS